MVKSPHGEKSQDGLPQDGALQEGQPQASTAGKPDGGTDQGGHPQKPTTTRTSAGEAQKTQGAERLEAEPDPVAPGKDVATTATTPVKNVGDDAVEERGRTKIRMAPGREPRVRTEPGTRGGAELCDNRSTKEKNALGDSKKEKKKPEPRARRATATAKAESAAPSAMKKTPTKRTTTAKTEKAAARGGRGKKKVSPPPSPASRKDWPPDWASVSSGSQPRGVPQRPVSISSDSSSSSGSSSSTQLAKVARLAKVRPAKDAALCEAMATAGVSAEIVAKYLGDCATVHDVGHVPKEVVLKAAGGAPVAEQSRLLRLRDLCEKAAGVTARVQRGEHGAPRRALRQDDDVIEDELDGRAVRRYWAKYREQLGADPMPEEEPSAAQLTALKTLLDEDRVPYADFAVYGSKRAGLAGKPTVQALHIGVDGVLRQRRVPGPSSFPEWWASFRIFRASMVMLEGATAATLGHYGETIRRLVDRGVPWSTVYDADVRMRRFEWETLRREAERGAERSAGLRAELAAQPWEVVIRRSVAHVAFWQEEAIDKTLLWRTAPPQQRQHQQHQQQEQQQLQWDTPGADTQGRQPIHGGNGAPGGGKKRGRGPKPRMGEPGSGRTATGQQVCFAWNRERGCAGGCGRVHVCERCMEEHPKRECTKRR